VLWGYFNSHPNLRCKKCLWRIWRFGASSASVRRGIVLHVPNSDILSQLWLTECDTVRGELARDVAGIEMAHARIRFSLSVLQEIVLKDTDHCRLRREQDYVSELWQSRCGAGALGSLPLTTFKKECMNQGVGPK
jgi:hypothetical protein